VSLDGILDSIRTTLATALTELKTVQVVGGNFTLSEKARRSATLPAAFVLCNGTEDGAVQNNKAKMKALFVVVLAVAARAEGQATPQDRAHAIARLVGRALKVVINAKVWGNDEVEGPPTNVDSRNRYTTDADNAGVALWAISWQQAIALTDDPPPADLDDLHTVHAEYVLEDGSVPDVPDAIDDIEYTP
jgi:hypothetical protein